MNPQGTLSTNESASGIVKVSFDPATENGEFYQVHFLAETKLTVSGTEASIRGNEIKREFCIMTWGSSIEG